MTGLLVTDTLWALAGAELARRAPGIEPILMVSDQPLTAEELGRARIACLSGDAYPERIREVIGACVHAPNLQWLHTFSAGVDAPVFGTFLERGVRLTNSSGASAPSIARTVIAGVLALSRDLPAWFRAQQERSWAPRRYEEIIGQRLVVVGWGPIARETARLADALGLEIEIVRREAAGDEPFPVTPLIDLRVALARADWVVVALPLTEQTRNLFDADAIAAMRPTARFVNIGRGELVDESALTDALASGRLAGAALDVFATEPLPPESPLWGLPNVIVTPHASGITDHTDALGRALFCDNVEAFVNGRPLRNEVLHR